MHLVGSILTSFVYRGLVLTLTREYLQQFKLNVNLFLTMPETQVSFYKIFI